MPSGTRSIIFKFVGIRQEGRGKNNDAYLDAAFIEIVESANL